MKWPLLAVVAATVALAPACVLAVGAPVRNQPVPVSSTVVPPVLKGVVKPKHVLGGCGGKRVRDPVTKLCRGPGDIGR
jgi:hypothetical protein